MTDPAAEASGRDCPNDIVTCPCLFHSTMRAVAILRQYSDKPLVLSDRETHRPLYIIDTDGNWTKVEHHD